MGPRGMGLLPTVGILGVAAAASAHADEVLRPDFACFNPISQVLKDRLWVQKAIGPGVQVPLQYVGREWPCCVHRPKRLPYGCRRRGV